MATHDYIISNASGASVRADLNNALAAIVSNNSNATSPATTYAYQWWADTTTGQLKLRNSANSAWITIFELDGTMLMEDGTAAAPGLSFASDTNTGIFRPSNNALAISANGSVRMTMSNSSVVVNQDGNDVDFRVESSGNANMLFVDAGNDRVGIGTAAPSNLLHLNGTSDQLRIADGSNGFDIRAGGSFIVEDDGVERLRIDSSGRVGVGTSSPGRTLDVSGVIRADGTSGALAFGGNSSTPSEGCAIHRPASNEMAFVTNSAERLRIDSSGNLGIGAAAPAAKLDVAGNQLFSAANPQIQFNAGGPIIRLPAANTLAFLSDSSTERARIDSSGRLLVGTSTARTDYFNNTLTATLQVEGTAASGAADRACFSIVNNNNATNLEAPVLVFGRSRGSTVNSKTLAGSGTRCGYMSFQGADGNDMVEAASIAGEVDGASGANDMPGRLVFYTTADGASGATERLRIDSSGRVGIGTTSADEKLSVNGGHLHIRNTTESYIYLTNTTAANRRSYIAALEQTGNSNDLVFATNANGVDGTEKMRLKSNGEVTMTLAGGDLFRFGGGSDHSIFRNGKCGLHLSTNEVLPTNGSGTVNDNTMDIGASSLRFDDIFATNGTIQTSDQTLKQDVAALTTAEIAVAKRIRGLVKTYRWIDSVEAKGDNARIHCGVIAQEVEQAFTDEGLDVNRYALFTSNTWYEANGVPLTPDGPVTADDEGAVEVTRRGVRYPELLAFVMAGVNAEMADVASRLAALEAT